MSFLDEVRSSIDSYEKHTGRCPESIKMTREYWKLLRDEIQELPYSITYKTSKEPTRLYGIPIEIVDGF